MVTSMKTQEKLIAIHDKNGQYVGTVKNGEFIYEYDETKLPVCCGTDYLLFSQRVDNQLKRAGVHTLLLRDIATGRSFKISLSKYLQYQQIKILASGKYFLLPLDECNPIVWDESESGRCSHG